MNCFAAKPLQKKSKCRQHFLYDGRITSKGKVFISRTEFDKFIKTNGITRTAYLELVKEGELPPLQDGVSYPINPQRLYKNFNWAPIPAYMPLPIFWRKLSSLGRYITYNEYVELFKSGSLPEPGNYRYPQNAPKHYQYNHYFITWTKSHPLSPKRISSRTDEPVNISNKMTLLEFRTWTKKEKLNLHEIFIAYRDQYDLPRRAPSNPVDFYGVSAADIFSAEMMSVEEFRHWIQDKNIPSFEAYSELYSTTYKSIYAGFIPEDPELFYEIPWADIVNNKL